MSAYLCDGDTFDYLATAAQLFASGPIDPERVAHVLRAENIRSMRARYGDVPELDSPYTFERVTVAINPAYVLASLQCLEYQSCETADYHDSAAYAIVARLRRLVLVSLGLPEDHNPRSVVGYKDAPWGWTRDDGAPTIALEPTAEELATAAAKRSARWLSAAELAKLIRASLASAYPRVTFRVRSRNYAGGSSVDVSWQDGPPRRAVDRTLAIFARKTFDGMTDSTSNAGPFQLPGSSEWLNAGSYINTAREFTATAKAQIESWYVLRYGRAEDATATGYDHWKNQAFARAGFDVSGVLIGMFDVKS